jgi:putative oxidoreductase
LEREFFMGFGLLLLRVVVGTLMALHGGQKLFGWYGGPGLEGTSGWLGSMGFKPQRLHATIVGVSEFAAGCLLVLGFFTPFAAAAVIGVMIVAVATVHWSNGLFNTAGGYEFNLSLAAIAAALAFIGPGRFSFDNALGMNMKGLVWGFASIALAGMAAALTLFSRNQTVEATETAVTTAEAEEDTEVLVVDLSEERPHIDA